MKVLVSPTQAVIDKIRAEGEAAARRATSIHPAVAHLVPQAYSLRALGWTVPYAIEGDAKLTRTALVADDAFAVGKVEFVSAATKLPDDWGDAVEAPKVGGDGGTPK